MNNIDNQLDAKIPAIFFNYSACSITVSNTTCSGGVLHIHFLATMISYLLNLHICDW